MAQPDIPFKRVIKDGMTGDDIIAIKIIASRAGFWPWAEFDNIAHKQFMHGRGNVKRTRGLRGLQEWLGIEADGVYGPITHKASLPKRVPQGRIHAGEYIWDGHSQQLYKGQPEVDRRKAVVADIFRWWQWMVDREPQIAYSQLRPMRELSRKHEPPQIPYSEDCSSTFIYAAFLGGARSPDPDFGYTGYGNTGSLVRGGFYIEESEIKKYQETYYLGVLYGTTRWNTHHISAIMRPDRVYSMGNQGAPEIWSSIHHGPGQILCCRAYPVI